MFFGKNKENSTVLEAEVKEKGIYVLGLGCKNCNDLENNLKEALVKLNVEEEVYHIADFRVISSFGVINTPALVIDNQLLSHGKVLTVNECIEKYKKVRP